MTFDVAAESYGRFMGRFSEPLSALFLEQAGLRRRQSALDVGCGPGALTARLVDLLGSDAVTGVDPSTSFVEAAQARFPEVDIRRGTAEALPFHHDAFDAALAQLAVHFMEDPVAGLREMGRVTRPGGVVAACVWDHGGGQGPLTPFWQDVKARDPGAQDESELAGAREGDLPALFAAAGLRDVEATALPVGRDYASFEDWWEPSTLRVGPAGAYVAALAPEDRDALRERCRALVPEGPFTLTARAWAALG